MDDIIKPMYDYVLVKRRTENKIGSVYTPETTVKQLTGKVIAIGPGKITTKGERVPIDLQVGDSVLFGIHAGIPLNGDRDTVFMKYTDITGVYDES